MARVGLDNAFLCESFRFIAAVEDFSNPNVEAAIIVPNGDNIEAIAARRDEGGEVEFFVQVCVDGIGFHVDSR